MTALRRQLLLKMNVRMGAVIYMVRGWSCNDDDGFPSEPAAYAHVRR